jgi:hypothetical protein
MIVLDQGLTASHLYALELGQKPFMHRFCEGAGSLALTGSEAPTNGAIVLTPDGLFLAASGGAFRFDLATPYCD